MSYPLRAVATHNQKFEPSPETLPRFSFQLTIHSSTELCSFGITPYQSYINQAISCTFKI